MNGSIAISRRLEFWLDVSLGAGFLFFIL